MTSRIPRTGVRLALVFCIIGHRTPLIYAAGESDVLLADDFSIYHPALGVQAAGQEVKDNALRITVPADTWNRKFYRSARLGDADVTIRVRLPNLLAKDGAYAGLMFWGVDSGDFYALTVIDEGYVGIQRYHDGQWVTPLGFRPVKALKTATSQWNDLRVVTQGHLATAYVNGEVLGGIQGRAPEGGGLIGMLTYPGAKPLTAEFAALKAVRPVGAPATIPPALPPGVVYELGPLPNLGWGPFSDALVERDGALNLKVLPHNITWRIYVGDGWRELAVNATVLAPAVHGDSKAAVGIAFWAKGSKSFSAFMVGGDGTCTAFRYDGAKTTNLIAPTPVSPAAKFDLRQPTHLNVLAGPQRAVLMINQQRVFQLDGPAPPGWLFGVVGRSGPTPVSIKFTKLLVTRGTAIPAK